MILQDTRLWCPVNFKKTYKYPWPSKNKYGAKKVTVDGILFHSKREAAYYGQLKMMKAAGMISAFDRQYVFHLFAQDGGPGRTTGTGIGKHIVDFLVIFPDGRREVHEVKGMETDVFKLKRKIFEANYPQIKYVIIK